MDHLSEYIPLLIIIASVIISIVRKSKQPAEKVDMPEDTFEPEEPQPYFVREEPVSRKTPTPTQKKSANYKKVVETPEVNEYESINIDLSDQEEMKKAIIYSEIFNRKDF